MRQSSELTLLPVSWNVFSVIQPVMWNNNHSYLGDMETGFQCGVIRSASWPRHVPDHV